MRKRRSRPASATRDQPADFERLREYVEESVEQLLATMEDQAFAYAVPASDVLGLVKAVAAVREELPWDVLESWALRHAIPAHVMIRRGVQADDRVALRKRLRDLLGYVVLGIVMCETEGL